MADWDSNGDRPSAADSDVRVRLGFERKTVTLAVDRILPLKALPAGVHDSKKFQQIVSSIRAIGLVESPAVVPDTQHAGQYFLVDGHLRIEALKQLGIEMVECLIATDDETYTYNKRVNRLPPVQEHRMIVRAMERGVASAEIADALGLEVQSIRRRFRLLDGISPEAADMLKETTCSMKVFDILRRMSPMRQIKAADLMVGQNNFTIMFARALLAATPESQLVTPAANARKRIASGPTSEQISRMERELAALQTQVKSVEDSYGVDNLHLTVARGYIGKLLGNARIVRWLSSHQQEYLGEFQRIAEIEAIGPPPAAEV